MKLANRMNKKLMALLLAMVLATTPIMAEENTKVEQVENIVQNEASSSKGVDQAKKQEIRLQDDFYGTINKEWLESTTLKPGYVSMSAFGELSDQCQEQLKELFAEILKNEAQYKDTDVEKKMINLYKNYLNREARNKQGIEPIKPYLEKIKAIKNIEDLETFLSDMILTNTAGFYSLSISSDYKNSNQKAFYVNSTNLILGDSDYYNKPDEHAQLIEAATTDYLGKMLVLVGYSEEEAAQKVQQAYAFEKKFADKIIGQEEVTKTSNIYEKIYNVYTLDELDQLAPHMKLKEKIKKVTNNQVEKVIVTEPVWLESFDKLYNNDSIGEMKNYLEIKFLCGTVGNLSEDFEKIADEYSAQLTGVQGTLPDEQEAMQVINAVFSDAIGKLYVEKYFTEEAKEDVEELVYEIIDVYKNKLEAVDWMAEDTKKNAIKKLDTMKVKIGYPNEWEDYEGLEFKSYDEGGSLLDNSFEMAQWSYDTLLEELNKPIDKTKFVMPPQTVNACYNPTSNDITFPAGILQVPFYDVNRSKEANLGGIGAVIAHEISHAFDTNGANFDEMGNVKQWWTQEDYAKFEEKAKKVREFYSNVTVDSGKKVNGDLTVSENIADITGLSCMLDIMKTMENPDYEAFFESWATIWRMVSTPEYESLALEQDSHSPNKVRANIVLGQFQEFYDTYDIKEEDGMYIKPEDRLKVY